MLRMVGLDFFLSGLVISTALWALSNRFFTHSSHTHATDQTVEWAYSFDVHTNSFWPVFLELYLAQLVLSPVITRSNWICLFFGNTLYLGACSRLRPLDQAAYFVCVNFVCVNPKSRTVTVPLRDVSRLQCSTLPHPVGTAPFPRRGHLHRLGDIAPRLQRSQERARILLWLMRTGRLGGTGRRETGRTGGTIQRSETNVLVATLRR